MPGAVLCVWVVWEGGLVTCRPTYAFGAVGCTALQVTLPARFLCKTAHLVAVLTILFDTGNVAMNMEQIDPDGVDTSKSDLNLYNDRKNQ